MEISFWVLLWVIRYLNILVYREKAEGRKGEREKSAATHVHTASYELTYPGLLQTGLSVIAWHYLHRLPSFFLFLLFLCPRTRKGVICRQTILQIYADLRATFFNKNS
jgi:hypothetical protein